MGTTHRGKSLVTYIKQAASVVIAVGVLFGAYYKFENHWVSMTVYAADKAQASKEREADKKERVKAEVRQLQYFILDLEGRLRNRKLPAQVRGELTERLRTFKEDLKQIDPKANEGR